MPRHGPTNGQQVHNKAKYATNTAYTIDKTATKGTTNELEPKNRTDHPALPTNQNTKYLEAALTNNKHPLTTSHQVEFGVANQTMTTCNLQHGRTKPLAEVDEHIFFSFSLRSHENSATRKFVLHELFNI
jgi:hypothetical protein